MSKTILEVTKIQNNLTEVESHTVLDESIVAQKQEVFIEKFYNGYQIVKPLSTLGAEADLYLVEKDKKEYVLKLYRHGINPSKDLSHKLSYISEKYSEDIVRIYETKFSEEWGRWFEIQEFAKFGSLKSLLKINNTFFLDRLKLIIEEMNSILKAIHDENIIHRDLKPDNILVRSIDPLDLIITDFGISSLIDEDISKKMTNSSGTRMYFSPESFSGFIGKEVDYWALGMIILEIIEGSNIFNGMHEGIIANEIFTKGIEIPDYIDNDYKLLLKGLLTRDPKNRWGNIQVEMWLKGKRDIPIYYIYSDNSYSKEDVLKPYIFQKKKFYTLNDLLLEFYNEENYELLKEHIMRGYILKWLEINKKNDEIIVFEKYLKYSDYIDLNIFLIFNYFVKPNSFIFNGKIISIQSLFDDFKINSNLWEENLQKGILKTAYDLSSAERDIDLEDFFKKIFNIKESTDFDYKIELESLFKIYIKKGFAYKVIKNQGASGCYYTVIYNLLDTANGYVPQNIIKKINNKERIELEPKLFLPLNMKIKYFISKIIALPIFLFSSFGILHFFTKENELPWWVIIFFIWGIFASLKLLIETRNSYMIINIKSKNKRER